MILKLENVESEEGREAGKGGHECVRKSLR